MSPWQTLRELARKAGLAEWPDLVGSYVLGAGQVVVTPGVEDEEDLPDRYPFALLNLGQQLEDEDDPDLFRQEFNLVLAQAVEGDPFGQASIVGAGSAESDRANYSAGRGILEIERPVLLAMRALTGADGLPIQVVHQSAVGPAKERENRNVVWRQYILSAFCTRQDEYPAPSNLVGNPGGAGEAVLSWTLPPDRFDRYRIRVRRAVGSTPPASATDGNEVVVAAAATGVTVTGLAAGVHSFAIFESYDEANSPASADQRHSSQVDGTTKSVTVT